MPCLPRGFCTLLVLVLDPSPAVAQSFSPPLPAETTEAPGRPEGHFALAASLGHAGQTRDVRERVEHADEILSEAKEAIALDPRHDGAIESLREIDTQDREYKTRAKALLRRIGEGGGR